MKVMVSWIWKFFKREEKLMNVEINKSRTYIVPIIDRYININRGLLVNSYLYDINNSGYNIDSFEGIFLLFKWSNNEVHKLYEGELIKNKFIELHYDFDEEHFMVFCRFPIEVYEDCNNLIEGKYSKIKEENKKAILRYWQVTNTSKLYYVLYKDSGYRKKLQEELNVRLPSDCELGNIFNMSKEVFNFNKKDVKLLK